MRNLSDFSTKKEIHPFVGQASIPFEPLSFAFTYKLLPPSSNLTSGKSVNHGLPRFSA